jgi:hypothetical protein
MGTFTFTTISLGLKKWLPPSISHQPRDIMTPREPKEWEKIVTRMVLLSEPRISPAEAGQILDYLQATYVPKPSVPGPETSLIGRYCSPFHVIEDIERRKFDRKEWEKIVRRMSKRAPDIVPPGKIKKVVDALVQGNL